MHDAKAREDRERKSKMAPHESSKAGGIIWESAGKNKCVSTVAKATPPTPPPPPFFLAVAFVVVVVAVVDFLPLLLR